MIYRDPILVKLRDILNKDGPKMLKDSYYFGDPLVVNVSKLPACFISFDRQQITNADNAHLESNMSIVFNVVYDHKRDINQAFDNIESHMSVVDIIEGRAPANDPSNPYAIRKDTILGALRLHEDLGNNLWIDVGTASMAEYGIGIGKRGPGIYTAEGIVRIQVKHHQIKPEYM